MDNLLAGVGYGDGHMGDWGGAWMWLWGLVMMAVVVALVVWVVRSLPLGQSSQGRDPLDRPREILAERYARGDLSTEEYRERLSELDGG